MISRADCISEPVSNGNRSPRGNLCYLGSSLGEESGSTDRNEEKKD